MSDAAFIRCDDVESTVTACSPSLRGMISTAILGYYALNHVEPDVHRLAVLVEQTVSKLASGGILAFAEECAADPNRFGASEYKKSLRAIAAHAKAAIDEMASASPENQRDISENVLVQTLDARTTAAVLLAYVKGLGCEKISEALNLGASGNVKKLIYDEIRRLLKLIAGVEKP